MKQLQRIPAAGRSVQTGIQAWLDQALSLHDSVVVSSSSLSRGFLAPDGMNDTRVDRTDGARKAVLNASGRFWGGQETALLLEGRNLQDAVVALESMRDAGQGVMATLWPQPEDLSRILRALLDTELTVLAAGSLQETLDLSAAASVIASRSGQPCVVLGSVRESAWTLGRFDTVKARREGSSGDGPTAGPMAGRVDPFNPTGVRLPLTGRMVLKQQAGRMMAAADLDALIVEAFAQVTAVTGRELTIHSGASLTSARFVVPSCFAPPLSLHSDGLHLTQVFPLPHALTDGKPVDHRVAVLLPAGLGSDLRHPLVRAFDSIQGTGERRRSGFFRRAESENMVRPPLTVLVDPGTWWSAAHLEAIEQALDDPDASSDLRVLDAQLSADTRIPAIEEAVHASRSNGFDPSALDLVLPPVQREERTILIGARHPHTALSLASRILERAEAGAVAAPISTNAGGDALIFVRLSGLTPDQGRSRVLIPDSHLIDHRILRSHVPDATDVIVPESAAGQLPRWMTERDRALFVVPSDIEWDTMATSPLQAASSDVIRAATEEDLLAVGARPPEEKHALTDASPARASFLRTLGHLQDMDRLDEAPVDDWILSGSTPPLVPRPNRWQNETRPIPDVVGEKCTGCAACWSICPETAITSRAFSIAEVMTAASDRAPGPFVHLPRLLSAWISTTHSVLTKDDLGQHRLAGDLLKESLDQLLTSAGVTDTKAVAIREEADRVIEQVAFQELIRTDDWFAARERAEAGTGLLLALQVDPSSCTHCGLCTEICAENAVEEQLDLTHGQAFRQLDQLPGFHAERRPTKSTGLPGTLLTGSSASAAFRAGSSDRANLNRTAIRLAVAAHSSAVRGRSEDTFGAVEGGLKQLEKAIQDSAQQRLRINDFESFGRQLEAAAGDVSDVLQSLLKSSENDPEAQLSELSDLHRHLVSLRDELHGDGSRGSALCVVNSLQERSDGLAPFPSNPYATSALVLPPDQAVSIIPGLVGAWMSRLEKIAGRLRHVRQLMDGTLEPESAYKTTEEDRAWAEAHVPRVLWIVDRYDEAMLSLLKDDLPVHVCWLDGGPTLAATDSMRPAQVRALMPNLNVLSTHSADPVALLEHIELLSDAHQGMIHVYTPDPVRDGVPVSAIQDLIETAGAAGLVGFPNIHMASLADWMIVQERFRSRFSPVPRTDWSSDQVPVSQWLSQNAKERSRVQPCVITGSGKAEERWLPDAAVLRHSERWYNDLKVHAAESTPQRLEESDAATPPPAPEVGADTPTVPADVHAQLTERLLALSGFQSGGISLKAFIEGQQADVQGEPESGMEQSTTTESDAE